MPHGFPRRLRISAILRTELAALLAVSERAAMVTITDVAVARDLSLAKVYCSALAGDASQLAARLEARRSELRAQLAKRLSMRKVPQLQFICEGGSLDDR